MLVIELGGCTVARSCWDAVADFRTAILAAPGIVSGGNGDDGYFMYYASVHSLWRWNRFLRHHSAQLW